METVLQRAKGIPIQTDRPELTVVVRFESLCIANTSDECLTIIGQIINDRFMAQAMFFAGPRMNRSDIAPTFFGAMGRPYRFYSTRSVTALIETPAGWIVGTAPIH
jgi:hypothetical protein